MVESTDIDGTIVVEYKLDGRKYTTLTRGVDYDVIYLSNTNKGKATILIVGRDNADRKFTGTKKTGFTISTFNIKNSK